MTRLEEIRELLDREVAAHPESGDHVILTLRGYDLRMLLQQLEEARRLLKVVVYSVETCDWLDDLDKQITNCAEEARAFLAEFETHPEPVANGGEMR
jgi:hypothetical protein